VCCPLRLRHNQPLSADLLPKLPQSFATNIAVFVANDVAARAAKTAGVNRKSYVIQTPLTLILAPADHIRWLSDEPDPHDLLRPYPAEPMRMWPISTRVNKPENDDPSILQPIELSAA
jgi:hypothetical protein